MHLVMVASSADKSTIYEFETYAKAKYFAQKNKYIGAKFLGKARRVDNLDLFADRVPLKGRKYQHKNLKREVSNG